MSKITIKKIPDEQVYYDWEDEVGLAERPELEDRIVVRGERSSTLYPKDGVARKIVEGDYYDEDDDGSGEQIGYGYECIAELNKVLGGEWATFMCHGYSQGDWAIVYYDREKVDEATLDEIDAYLMGKVSEFRVVEGEDEYCVYVPHDVCWNGKKAICEYIGVDQEAATVLEDDGYEKVYKYKEVF